MNPAIVAVGYNRPDSMRRLLGSIAKGRIPYDDVTLIVSIDESPQSDEVEAVARAFAWTHGEKIIRRFPERQGLRPHILQCGGLTEQYGAVIVLEDDLMVAPDFYEYVKQALEFYRDDPKIAGVSLYSHGWSEFAYKPFCPKNNGYDAYLGQFTASWGQCWTHSVWGKFMEWYKDQNDELLLEKGNFLPGQINLWSKNSWAKFFSNFIVEKDLYYVVPYVAMSTNFSEVGQHCINAVNTFNIPLQMGLKDTYRFCGFQSAVRYDMFLERLNLEGLEELSVDCDDLCVNLIGNKPHANGKRYYLTMGKPLAKKIVRSYGLQARPIDMNIEYQIPGDTIRLYDMTVDAPVQKMKTAFYDEMKYYLYGHGRKQLRRYARIVTFRLYKAKFRKLWKLITTGKK